MSFIASDYDFNRKKNLSRLAKLRTAKSQTTLTENTVEAIDLGGCHGVRQEKHCDNSTAKKPTIAMKTNAK